LNELPKPETIDPRIILARQQSLNRRLAWLLILPFGATIIMVIMFLVLSARLRDVEIGTQLVTIERYVVSDKTLPWAINQYEQIAATRPTAPILARLGSLYFQSDPDKNREIALQKLEMAKQADPQYWETYRNLTYVYFLSDRTRDAIEAGSMAVKLNPIDAASYNNLAFIYATSKDPAITNLELALRYAQKAVELTKEQQSDYLDTLAVVYHNLNDSEKALANFRKAKATILGLQKLEKDFKKNYPDQTL
jgi:tetratricopeptide (TPR) repeat protein